MKKKTKLVTKNIGLGCAATLCAASVVLGGVCFVDFAKKGFGDVNADTKNEQPEDPDIQEPIIQEYKFMFRDGAVVGYEGEMPQKLVIPQSYSISGSKTITSTLDNYEAFEMFCFDTMDSFNSAANEEVFNYTFIDVLGNKTVCKSINDLDDCRMNYHQNADEIFPLTLEALQDTYSTGTDILVTEINPSFFNAKHINDVKSITIPKSVVTVDSPYSMANASNLEEYIVEQENTKFKSVDGVLVERESNAIVAFPNGKTGDYVMPNDLGFTDIYGGCLGMFRKSQLSSFRINDNVTTIYPGMFSNCSIGTIILGNGIKTIESMAFEHFAGNEIILNEGLESIGESAFNCAKLDTINIPNSVQTIKGGAFYYSDIESIVIPENVTLEGGNWFGNCKNLTTVVSYIEPERLADSNIFQNSPQNITIYVPTELIVAYQTAYSSASNITIQDVANYNIGN